MRLPRFVVGTFSLGVIVSAIDVASSQNYPNKPIRIVASSAGGGADFGARIIAQAMSGSLGQPVIVDNRAALVAIEVVAKAPADGYTLLLASSTLWIGPLIQKASYDPVQDFSPISILQTSPNVLVVHPSLPVKSVKDLIALAKAKPGELNYSSSAIGGSPHLAAELFKAMAGVNIVQVTYKGSAPALNAVIAGEVQLSFANAAAGLPSIKSGRLKALAVASLQPSALFPGVPTVAATGLPGYESAAVQGVLAPAKTPAIIIDRLHQEIVRNLNNSDVKENLFNIGAEIVGSSPKEFATAIKADMVRLGKVIKDAGISAL